MCICVTSEWLLSLLHSPSPFPLSLPSSSLSVHPFMLSLACSSFSKCLWNAGISAFFFFFFKRDLYPWWTRLYHPWNSPGQNTGVGSLSLLQGSSQAGDWTQVSCIAGGFFTNWALREAPSSPLNAINQLYDKWPLDYNPVQMSWFHSRFICLNLAGTQLYVPEQTPILRGTDQFHLSPCLGCASLAPISLLMLTPQTWLAG